MKTAARWMAIGLLLCSSLAMALDVGGAKAQGLVGEQPDGYLGVVKATPEAVSLAADINAKRREAYDAIDADMVDMETYAVVRAAARFPGTSRSRFSPRCRLADSSNRASCDRPKSTPRQPHRHHIRFRRDAQPSLLTRRKPYRLNQLW